MLGWCGIRPDRGRTQVGRPRLHWAVPGAGFGGPLEHGRDLGHRDDIEIQGCRAGRLDPLGAVAAHQAQQPVDGAHPGPRQRVIEDPVRRRSRRPARGGAGGDEAVQIPQRVAELVLGQIGGVGVPTAGRLAGVDLDQHPRW